MSVPAASGARATPSPARFLRRARRVLVFLALAGLFYAVARFDVVLLPEGALSPLFGIHAGDRLLVDRGAGDAAHGDVWLFRGAEGELLLGRVGAPPAELAPDARARLDAGACWLESEREVPGVADSRDLGPIAEDALVGRVVLVLPW